MNDISIRQLRNGQPAVITAIQAQGELGRRIRDLGLIPGTMVTVCGRAPLQDPVALKIGGTVLTLRNSEADHIMVTPT
ncbi:MAG: ferrous iron transport protein A [Desulfofustis sp.]|nr:ferrous iron transport protein A [Desulfofustis sp.]